MSHRRFAEEQRAEVGGVTECRRHNTLPLVRIVATSAGCWLLATLTAFAASDGSDSPIEFFEKHVRPLLVAKCLECHGDQEPEAGLRLTSRENVLRGGEHGAAAVAGRSEESLLVRAVRREGELKMPPDNALTDREIGVLRRWVELGLPWPRASGSTATRGVTVITPEDRAHWAFRPVSDPAPPAVRGSDRIQSDVDRFVVARLHAAGLELAPPADRRTLLRRACFDLIGLPPTWDETQAFVNDPAPTGDAFGAVIERLLTSPRYGERWGRHWLDVARFADTKDGVLMYGDDRIRPFAYTYRDYVIRAFNEDLPFDRFVHDQLAAELIEPPVEPWRLAAMGFLTLGRMYDNNLHDVIDDQIDTVTRGLLALTVSCSRCHDHKYDPVPTADYYSLYGVFAGSDAPLELPLVQPPDQTPGGVEFEEQARPKREELRKFLDEQFALLSEDARLRIPDYLVRVATTPPDPLETAIFFLSLAPEDLRPPVVARWRRFLAQRATADDPVFGPWHDLMRLSVGGSRQDPLTNAAQPVSNDTTPVPNSSAATFATAARGVLERWASRPVGTERGQLNPRVSDTLRQASLTSRADVARVYGELLMRVYGESKSSSSAAGTASARAPADAATQQLLDIVVSRDSPAWFPRSQTRSYMSRQPKDAFGEKIRELDRMAVQSPHAPPRAMVLHDSETLTDPQIFVRGNPSRPGRRVPRRFLEMISPAERSPFPNGSGRLDLARAITAPENPLTARVIVNRVWMHHFGEPLVSTPSDFGRRSSPPSHPELLDHLATRFVREGWSLKKLHRWIMASSVYQQASGASDPVAARAKTVDPDNRLLWRMHRRRLDFEAMRDTLLAVSGRLEHRSGGRPVDIAADPLNRCRTVYGLVDRQSLPSVFRAFDFASPDQSVERRSRTMVPQQALFAINSPFVIEQAKSLASRPEIAATPNAADRVAAMYRIVLSREPTADEFASCLAFINEPIDSASQLSTWEQLCQVLLAGNEGMYVD